MEHSKALQVELREHWITPHQRSISTASQPSESCGP